jgi:hypothetical protein
MNGEKMNHGIDFDRADKLMQQMDNELCVFLSESDVFLFKEDELYDHLLAMVHMFCQKAGRTLASMYVATNIDQGQLLAIAAQLTANHFHASLKGVSDKLLGPAGNA